MTDGDDVSSKAAYCKCNVEENRKTGPSSEKYFARKLNSTQSLSLIILAGMNNPIGRVLRGTHEISTSSI